MKHAFLIIAHNNWWQLKKLIECLDSDTHDIYVHVDKKSKDFDETYFKNSVTKSSLKFYREFEVYWGGFSQVQVEMFLFKQASVTVELVGISVLMVSTFKSCNSFVR